MRTFLITLASLTLILFSLYQFEKLSGAFTAEFDRFQENKPVRVEFAFSDLGEQELTDREKLDQMRDWLLLTVLSATTSDMEELDRMTFDFPTTRYGSLKTVGEPEFGELRSRLVDNGTAVVLMPPCSGNVRKDHLAHAADEQRKNLGDVPEKLVVFEYRIDVDRSYGFLTRRETVNGADLFGPEYGYYEKEVGSLADFEDFMKTVDDITFAKLDGSDLRLGGRKLQNRSYGKITVEDVAAIYQSEQTIAEKLARFEAKWDTKTYETETEKTLLLMQYERERKDLAIVDGSGFSLDPTYDCDRLLELFNERLAGFLREQVGMSFDEESKIARSLRLNDADPLLIFLGEKESVNPEVVHMVEQFTQVMRFQKARYDGPLEGTAVGMHLFYTDLLAKLWAINFVGSSPNFAIQEFSDYGTLTVARAFEKESEAYPSCRLWFGPFNKQFQLLEDKEGIALARNATKIYAASSNPLQPGQEVPASAFWETSLGWWNNHYEEVAAYEPEYERLNEIVKWSTIIGWLNAEDKGGRLSFLSAVPVKRDYWFPNWVRNNPDLKFDDWKQIEFHEKGFKGNKTEVMPILYAESARFSVMSGGVSLASKTELKALSALESSTSPLLRRPGIQDLGTSSLKTLKGTSYKFEKLVGGRAKLVSTPEAEVVFRGRFGECANQPVERILSRTNNLLEIEAVQGNNALGKLSVAESRNGFRVGFQSADLEGSLALTRRLSDAGADAAGFLRKAGEVEHFYDLGGGRYLVKLRNSAKYCEIHFDAPASVKLPSNWEARVSGISDNSRICNIRMIDEGGAQALTAGKTRIPGLGKAQTDGLMESMARGDFESVIQRIRSSKQSPAKIQEELARVYDTEVKMLQESVSGSGSCPQCQQRLDRLAEVFGNKPELKILRGRLELKNMEAAFAQNKPQHVADIVNQAAENPAGRSSDFFRELNHLLEQNNSDLAMRIGAMREFEQGARPVLKLRVDALDMQGFARVRPSELRQAAQQGEARLAVADHPSLSNVDFSASVENSLNQVMELHPDAIIYRIPKQDLGNYRLRLSVEPPNLAGRRELSVLRPNFQPRLYRSYFPCNDDDNQNKDQRHRLNCLQESSDLYVVYVPKAS